MPGKIQLSHFDLIGFVFDLIGFGATSSFAYFLFFLYINWPDMLLRHDSLRFVAMWHAPMYADGSRRGRFSRWRCAREHLREGRI